MAAPQDALASMPEQPAQPAPDGAASQPPQKPSLWRNVLEGALNGMRTGMGAVPGALDPKVAANTRQAQQQMQQAKVKFASAQAAAQWADAATKDAELKDLPATLKDDHDKNAAAVVKTYTDLFGNPTAVLPDTNDSKGAMQHLQDVTQVAGAVNHSLMVHTGGQIYLWDTSAAAQQQPDNALKFVNMAGKALGAAMLGDMTADQWKALPNAQKVGYMDVADDLFNTVTPDKKNFEGQIARLGQEQKTLQAKVQSDPTLQPLLDHVSANLKLVQDAQSQAEKTRPKTYADVAEHVTEMRNRTQTKEVLEADGVHLKSYNTATGKYDIEQGLAGTGAQGNRGSAASASIRMGDQLIADIQKNGPKLGTLSAWVQKYGLNTPIADPDLAGLQSELSSFAALQPVQHGFRSTDALHTFEAIIGGLQKNPKATIASIRALSQTSRAINPAAGSKSAAPAAAPAAPAAGGDFFSKFGGQQRQQ